jgi:hypothetical protein
MSLECFTFRGTGTLLSDVESINVEMDYTLALAEDADPELVDQAAQALAYLILQRESDIREIVRDN